MKTLALLTLLIASSVCAQQTLNVESKSQVSWQGKAAFSSYSPIGTLDVTNAKLTQRNDSLVAMSVLIDMTSLTQENKQLEGHLKEEDFFHVKKFPQATFTMTNQISLNDPEGVIEGIMTIKGQSKTEQIPVRLEKSEEGIRIEFDHKMDRTQYGINYNSPSFFKRLKENAIADNFNLRANLLFTNKD